MTIEELIGAALAGALANDHPWRFMVSCCKFMHFHVFYPIVKAARHVLAHWWTGFAVPLSLIDKLDKRGIDEDE